ncbi:uncharacterized protein SCDLUD_004860 [Saccharomycodes ludwigii]|uniref:uncharacterized protein n=1 Tax=Saccharomycodes ludwigii TaxID=36035 RepID=UPI001E8A5D2E|nr:hypothetical protein SCDLUD_004860 [Saccharomycodes ludwigii]KAH3899417.1 hypothetical protein SCDLUD_004860 [Saccharomycodes ludwigii]
MTTNRNNNNNIDIVNGINYGSEFEPEENPPSYADVIKEEEREQQLDDTNNGNSTNNSHISYQRPLDTPPTIPQRVTSNTSYTRPQVPPPRSSSSTPSSLYSRPPPPPPQPERNYYNTMPVSGPPIPNYNVNYNSTYPAPVTQFIPPPQPLTVLPGDPRLGGQLCPKCGGTGRVSHFLDFKLCKRCKGIGRINI